MFDTRHLFTHWDSCSVLDVISLIGGFVTFVNIFSSLDSIHRVFFMYLLHLAHVKDAHGCWFMRMVFI
jgi:hypothetical protein